MDTATPPQDSPSTHQSDPPKIQDAPFAAIDCESTGLSPTSGEAVAVAVVLANKELFEVAHLHLLIHPERLHQANPESLVICGYSADRWQAGGAVTREVAANALAVWLRGRRLLAHSLDFDKRFFADVLRAGRHNPPWSSFGHDTLTSARQAIQGGKLRSQGASLVAVSEALHLAFERQEGVPHDALVDARACLAVARMFRVKGWMRL